MRVRDPIPEDLRHTNGRAPEVSGDEVLDRLVGFIRRFVALSYMQAVLIALWIVHTHAIDAADCTPYVHIKSAEKRSGKTRLLEVLSLLVARPWLTGRVSAAVLVRKTANEQPSLLLDESDAAFKGDKEYGEALRGILNAGFRRGGVTSLCVGQGANISYEDFPVFGAKAIAGIGKLPDTVADRSVPIELQRRKPSEHVERFRMRKVESDAVALGSAAAAWAETHLRALAEAEPELPDELDDRAQDIIEPLLAIADEAGGEWPARARHAAVSLLTGEHRDDAESLGVRLLRDIRWAFEEADAERMRTTDILTALNKRDDAPWGSLRGEALDARGLARLLKPYGVIPKKLRERDGEGTFRGYERASFEDAWARYLPHTPEYAEQAEHPELPVDGAGSGVPHDGDVPEQTAYAEHEDPHRNADVPHVPHVPHILGGRDERLCIHDVRGGCWLCQKYQPEEWGVQSSAAENVANGSEGNVGPNGRVSSDVGTDGIVGMVRWQEPGVTTSHRIMQLLKDPPRWLADQIKLCRQDPERYIKPTAAAIASEVYGDANRRGEIEPVLEAWLEEAAGEASP